MNADKEGIELRNSLNKLVAQRHRPHWRYRGRRAFKGGTGLTTARPSDLHPYAYGKVTARLLAAHDNFVGDCRMVVEPA